MGRILNLVATALLAGTVASPVMAGTPQAGAQAFRTQCAVCHAVLPKSAPGVGPSLYGVVGRKAGTLPGFAYSPAMKASGLTWGEADLKRYLANPAQLDDVVAYLTSLK